MRILITGGCGFIGHHMVEHFLKNTDWEIVIFDRLSYAARGYDRLRDIQAFDDKRVSIFAVDFTHPISEGIANEAGQVDYIIHLGAETHVDNSITDPQPFVIANVVGTMQMLNYARSLQNLKWFVYFSTDEVFGPAPEGVNHKEWDNYNSTNPYAATKAGGEELSLAYANSYQLPVFITHTMNCFGERQHPEKFIPLTIKKILNGEVLTIHADKTKTQAGKRHYIHCRNVAAAIHFLLDKAKQRDKYNIVGEIEIDNLSLAKFIAGVIGKPLKYEMVDFHSSRPGHDLRYSLDSSKMQQMGWQIPKNFERSLTKTIKWTLERKADWL